MRDGHPLCSRGSKITASPGDRAEKSQGWERTKSMEPSGVLDGGESQRLHLLVNFQKQGSLHPSALLCNGTCMIVQ